MEYFWELDIAAAIVSLILFFILIFRKSYSTLIRNILKSLLLFSFLSSLFEILLLFVVRGDSMLPSALADLIVILFYVIHATLHLLFLLYVIVTFRGKIGTLPEKIVFSTFFALIIGLILTNPLHHLIYDLNSPNFYGPLVFIIEFSGVISIIYSFILTLIYRNKISQFKFNLSITFLIVWFLALLVDAYLSPNLITSLSIDGVFIENFAITVTFSLITILNDNPSDYLYPGTTVYNDYTFLDIYNEKLRNNISFNIVAFAFKDFTLYAQKVGKKRAEKAFTETIKHCVKKYGQKNVFALNRWVVAIDASAFKDLENDCATIAEECYAGGLRANPDCKLFARFAYFSCPSDCDNMNDLLISINMMLFGGNNLGKSIVTPFKKELIKAKHRKDKIVLMLHEAIDHDGFNIVYQPIFNCHTKKFDTLEALVRLNNDSIGYVSPQEFIPIAEEEGLIFSIDEIIFEKVCRFIRNSNIAQYGIKSIDINLSLLKLLDASTCDKYVELASHYDINPEMITLEITETAELTEERYETVRNNVKQFTEKGFTFALDDYGSGHSSVVYFAELDTKTIKIDSSILWNAIKQPKYNIVLENCVRLAKTFNKQCVVEGVENIEMVNHLKKLDIDYFQGYYYSKPIDEETLIKFLTKNLSAKAK